MSYSYFEKKKKKKHYKNNILANHEDEHLCNAKTKASVAHRQFHKIRLRKNLKYRLLSYYVWPCKYHFTTSQLSVAEHNRNCVAYVNIRNFTNIPVAVLSYVDEVRT